MGYSSQNVKVQRTPNTKRVSCWRHIAWIHLRLHRSYYTLTETTDRGRWSGGAAAHTSTLQHEHLLSFSSSHLSIQSAWNSCRQGSIRTRSPFLNWDRQTAHSFSSSSGPPADVRHGSRSTIDVGALPSLSRESSSCCSFSLKLIVINFNSKRGWPGNR